MKIRFVEWNSNIYVVVGIGYDDQFDPPDIYHCVPLTNSIIKDTIMLRNTINIPFSEAIEITDKKRIQALYTLFK